MAALASRLRAEVGRLALDHASRLELPYYESRGTPPVILFSSHRDGTCHGNFHDESYRAILARPGWAARLEKPAAAKNALPEERQAGAKELDSSNSSDALLMNCFCYPGAATAILAGLLPGLEGGEPEFGVLGKVPLLNGTPDMTEIDMRCGRIIFESKLTEADFTSSPKPHVQRYRDFANVFECNLLPQTGEEFRGYQLIRNVLAASVHDCSFIVLCDARRPDLLREWWKVHSAIRDGQLRARCGFLQWQEVAHACPGPLQEFLGRKYGLIPRVAA